MHKKIGGSIYIHKSNLEELKEIIEENIFLRIMEASKNLPDSFNFEIIKYNKKDNKVSFIDSSDWNTAREPLVGDSYVTSIDDFNFKLIKSKGQIYHHKWMFVSNDYNGFDIEESKNWSKVWTDVIPNEKSIKSRIGYKKYWDEILKEYNL